MWELRNSNSRLYPSSFRVDQRMNWVFGEPGKVGMDFDIVSVRSISFTIMNSGRD